MTTSSDMRLLKTSCSGDSPGECLNRRIKCSYFEHNENTEYFKAQIVSATPKKLKALREQKGCRHCSLNDLQSHTKLMKQCQEIEQNWTGRETFISVFVQFLTTSTNFFFRKGDYAQDSASTHF